MITSPGMAAFVRLSAAPSRTSASMRKTDNTIPTSTGIRQQITRAVGRKRKASAPKLPAQIGGR